MCYVNNKSHILVSCLPLTDPDNGEISCMLGDDNVLSYEDTCSFTCNTGYELTGSDIRTCQSNGNWNGIEAICTPGQCIAKSCITYQML